MKINYIEIIWILYCKIQIMKSSNYFAQYGTPVTDENTVDTNPFAFYNTNGKFKWLNPLGKKHYVSNPKNDIVYLEFNVVKIIRTHGGYCSDIDINEPYENQQEKPLKLYFTLPKELGNFSDHMDYESVMISNDTTSKYFLSWDDNNYCGVCYYHDSYRVDTIRFIIFTES